MRSPLLSMSTPPSPDMVQRLSEVVREALERSGWRFSCENSEFSSEEIAAPDGMLPMWMHRAQAWMGKSLGGQAAPMAYRIDGAALCAVQPEPEGPTASLPVWACYTHFAMEEWRQQHQDLARRGQPVPMDELYREWQGLLRDRRVQVLPPHPAPMLELGTPAPEPQRAGAGG